MVVTPAHTHIFVARWTSRNQALEASTVVVRGPMLLQLGQAALSLDSPDRTAAQVLACLHGPEGEPQSTETETTEPKGEDDGDTSMEDGPLATMQDSDRYGVVKIVWTAEEDQQLLQVRPETACRRFNRIAHGMDTAYASECACTPLT